MKIAAIYARVSSARQQQQETIASQVAAVLDYAQAHDYQINPHHLYQDEGYSGASLDRPALDRLRDAVAGGELEAVLILAPDRLARHFAYQVVVTEEFERAGCRLRILPSGQGIHHPLSRRGPAKRRERVLRLDPRRYARWLCRVVAEVSPPRLSRAFM